MAVYDEQELQRLLALPEEDLYADLFAHSEAGQGVLGSPGMRQQRGRKLFEAHRAKFRTVVCDEWQGCDKIERAEVGGCPLSVAGRSSWAGTAKARETGIFRLFAP